MSTGLYVTYGTAPADANGNAMSAGWSTTRLANGVVGSASSASSFNVAGSLELIPGIATVQAAVRRAKNGDVAGADGDNAIMIGATYELAQNIEIGLNHTTQSGSAWTALGAAAAGKKATTLLLESLF